MFAQFKGFTLMQHQFNNKPSKLLTLSVIKYRTVITGSPAK